MKIDLALSISVHMICISFYSSNFGPKLKDPNLEILHRLIMTFKKIFSPPPVQNWFKKEKLSSNINIYFTPSNLLPINHI